MEQLEDNLEALGLDLAPDQLVALDEVSEPKLNFPADFLKMSPAFAQGATTVNGVSAPPMPMMPATDDERF